MCQGVRTGAHELPKTQGNVKYALTNATKCIMLAAPLESWFTGSWILDLDSQLYTIKPLIKATLFNIMFQSVALN